MAVTRDPGPSDEEPRERSYGDELRARYYLHRLDQSDRAMRESVGISPDPS
ncbi:hypothetical protein ABZZ79_03310 [Streptomyces sp. NPDC006458]|uniref:hypothetical protein n=1 Tax=Streptomyces sp. NPDC006458 TaxID=3154302 RepID=UPI0033A9F4C4